MSHNVKRLLWSLDNTGNDFLYDLSFLNSRQPLYCCHDGHNMQTNTLVHCTSCFVGENFIDWKTSSREMIHLKLGQKILKVVAPTKIMRCQMFVRNLSHNWICNHLWSTWFFGKETIFSSLQQFVATRHLFYAINFSTFLLFLSKVSQATQVVIESQK